MKKMKFLQVNSNILRKLSFGITQARIGQDKTGISLSTQEVLKFNLDRALAHDAVHASWNYKKMMNDCEQKGIDTIFIHTKASNRKEYLLNPNLGTMINNKDEKLLNLKFQKKITQKHDISMIVTDGLSAYAIEQHFCRFLDVFYPKLKNRNFTIAPIVFALFGRVALADHVGMLLNSKFSIIFVGERPGLSAADSMGIYLTFDPKIGRQNSDRNCISNVRPPFGLSYTEASNQLYDLINRVLEAGFSGTNKL